MSLTEAQAEQRLIEALRATAATVAHLDRATATAAPEVEFTIALVPSAGAGRRPRVAQWFALAAAAVIALAIVGVAVGVLLTRGSTTPPAGHLEPTSSPSASSGAGSGSSTSPGSTSPGSTPSCGGPAACSSVGPTGAASSSAQIGRPASTAGTGG
jgi:hypothetical protein